MDEFYLLLLKVIIFLFGMTGLLVLMKRYGFRLKDGSKDGNYQREIRKLDSLPIGFRRYLLVLEVKDRIIVVGVSEKEMTPIAQWKKEE